MVEGSPFISRVQGNGPGAPPPINPVKKATQNRDLIYA
jgi:hypothetical protein